VRVLGITPGHHRSDHARAGEARRWRATGRWSRRGSVRPRWPEKSCRPGVPAWPGKPAPTAKPSHPQASPACRNTGFRQSTVPAKRLKPAGATTPRRTPHARAIQARAAWLQTAVAVQAWKADQPSDRRGGHLRPTDRRELARPRTRRPRTLHNGHPARTRPRTPPSTATRPPTPPTLRAIPNTTPPTSPRRNPTTRTKPTEHAHKAANPEHSTRPPSLNMAQRATPVPPRRLADPAGGAEVVSVRPARPRHGQARGQHRDPHRPAGRL
jgi:hypothetical protein